jgi:leucyl-tRNA synthetase
MKNIFLLILFVIISNKAIASIEGENLICDKDKRGYNFISKNKVKISSINLNELKTIFVNHSYEVAENVIFIQQSLTVLDKEKTTIPIGWIFRRNLDYVTLDYVNGDWSRRFLWNCEMTTSEQLNLRMKNKLNELIKVNSKKLKLTNP